MAKGPADFAAIREAEWRKLEAAIDAFIEKNPTSDELEIPISDLPNFGKYWIKVYDEYLKAGWKDVREKSNWHDGEFLVLSMKVFSSPPPENYESFNDK